MCFLPIEPIPTMSTFMRLVAHSSESVLVFFPFPHIKPRFLPHRINLDLGTPVLGFYDEIGDVEYCFIWY